MHDADPMAATADAATIPDPAYELLSRVVEAATFGLSPEKKTRVLLRVLEDLLDRESRVLASRPRVLHAALRLRGQALVLRLLRENWEHIGTAATVRERFGVANSTLYRAKDKGLVIAVRPHKDSEFLFPLEQFAPNKIESWVADVVRAVKNGAPAICFLYVRRLEMRWRSFADGLREPDTKKTTIRKVLCAAQRHILG